MWAALFERVAALTWRDAAIALSVTMLVGAIAWIGIELGQAVELLRETAHRQRTAEGAAKALEGRLQLVEDIVVNWDDEVGSKTRDLRLTGPATVLELRRPGE
jgi:hypothetical protein